MKKNVQIEFIESDEEFVNIGHILYKSERFIFFSSVNTVGQHDGFWLEELSYEKQATITELSDYLTIINRFVENACKFGFYDPFGMEKLEQKFDKMAFTDDNIVEKVLKFVEKEAIFTRVEVYGGEGNDKNIEDSSYREGSVRIKENSVSILNVRTEDDLLEFDKEWVHADFSDVFRITFGDLYLNQIQAAMFK